MSDFEADDSFVNPDGSKPTLGDKAVDLKGKGDQDEEGEISDDYHFLSPWSKSISSSSPIFNLVVGPAEISLFAHCDILCKLPFFLAACKGRFKESQTHKIRLPEDTPLAIGAIIEYLYRGSWDFTMGYNTSRTSVAFLTRLVQVSVAASKYGCLDLEKEAIAQFHTNFGKLLSNYSKMIETWVAVYRCTDSESGLRLNFAHGNQAKWEERGRSLSSHKKWLQEMKTQNGDELREAFLEVPEFGFDVYTVLSG